MVGALTDPSFPSDRASTCSEITCLRKDAFVASTNDSIFTLCDVLTHHNRQVQRKQLTKDAFDAMQKAVGITYNPHGLLCDKTTRQICAPVSTYTDDWAHSYLAKGIGGDELQALLHALKADHVTYEVLRNECKTYSWPRSKDEGRQAYQVFADKRAASNSDGWKSSISEFLYIAPIVLHYVQTHHTASLPHEVESFRRLCVVIDFLQAFKRGRVSDVAELERLQNEHFEKHQEVYGEQFTKPKWHSMLHLGDQIRRDLGILFDPIANERENKVPKKFGDSIQKMGDFSRTVLSRSLAHQIDASKKFKEYPHLIGETHYKEELDAWLSHSLYCGGMQIGKGDIVRNRDGEYLNILACGQNADALFILSDEFLLVRETRTTALLQRQLGYM